MAFDGETGRVRLVMAAAGGRITHPAWFEKRHPEARR
jgi:hypothetical protein